MKGKRYFSALVRARQEQLYQERLEHMLRRRVEEKVREQHKQ